jgi:hypothetical protein
LAAGAQHVVTLDSVTHGDRAGSARYRTSSPARPWRRASCRTGYPVRVLGLSMSASGGVAVRIHAGRGPSDRTPSGKSRQWFPAQPRCSGDRGGDSHCTRSGRLHPDHTLAAITE